MGAHPAPEAHDLTGAGWRRPPQTRSTGRSWWAPSGSILATLALLVASCRSSRSDGPPDGGPDPSGGSTASTVVLGPDDLPIAPDVPPVPAVGSLATDTDPHVLFVDPAVGDDGADGQTAASAWRSLQGAFDRLGPGDTLYLMGGEYTGGLQPGSSHFLLRASGTAEAWIRIAAAPGQAPRIVATAGNGIEVRGDYVAVEGLSVEGRGFGPGNDYGWGLLTRGNHHVRLAGNVIFGMAVGGITSVEATNLEITGNEVHDNSFWGPEQGSGISLWHSRDAGTEPGPDGYHDRIVGNLVYRNENKVRSMFRGGPIITDGNGIIVDQADETGYHGRVLVAENVIVDNGGRAVLVLESSRVDVVHNTTYHNGRTAGLEGGPAELVAGQARDVRFIDNLAWARPGAMAAVTRHASDTVSAGNVFVADGKVAVAGDTDLVIADGSGLVRLPAENPAVADFRPAPGSLLVGRAVALDAIDGDGDRGGDGVDVGGRMETGDGAPAGPTAPVGGGTVGAYQALAATGAGGAGRDPVPSPAGPSAGVDGGGSVLEGGP